MLLHEGEKTRFDIFAKFDQPPQVPLSKAQRQLLLRSLLQQRFSLKEHGDTKMLPVFNLVIANASTLTKADVDLQARESQRNLTDAETTMSVGHGELDAKAVKIDSLLPTLQSELGRKVINQTGLNDRYNIKLRWLPESEIGEASGSQRENDLTLVEALRQQSGLGLVPARAPVKIIVVDHVERPQPN